MATIWGPIAERIAGDVVILELCARGVRLSDDVGRLLAKIREQVDRGRVKILLHLADVQFIDGEGLGEIVNGFKTVRAAGGVLALCHVAPRIRDLLVETKLDSVIRSHESEQEAVAALRRPGVGRFVGPL